MPLRKTILAPGEFFHIYNRGNSKQRIFLDDEDKARFVSLLFLCNSKRSFNYRNDIIRADIDIWSFDRGESIVSIGAWVIMPNHFHIYLRLVRDKAEENGKSAASIFMEKLARSYAQYFNTKYNRTGALFEGRFKAVHITTDTQAKYNFSYIHLNSIKLIDSKWREKGLKDFSKAKKFLEGYKWSSYLDYRGKIRPENKILNVKDFPKYFKNMSNFDSEINEWLRLVPDKAKIVSYEEDLDIFIEAEKDL
ncbi:MAG: hypothetical protein WD991_01895 [Candidatus Paceibacterota bacterium]